MFMAKEHVNYMDKQHRLGTTSVVEVDPPWCMDGLEEVKWQLRSDISNLAAITFNFSTMNIRNYSFDIIEQFVLFVKRLAEENQVKVVVSALPPRYVGQWGNRQISEHNEVNDCLIHFMRKHQLESVGVVMAYQERLACDQGRLRWDRFTDWGALSYSGTFLYLKNVALTLVPPHKTRGHNFQAGGDRSWGGGNKDIRSREMKILKLLENILSEKNGNKYDL